MSIQAVDKIIRELMAKTGVVSDVEFTADEEHGMYWFAIKTDNPQFFLHKNGESLAAFNYVARKLAEKVLSPEAVREMTLILDVDNYQRRHIEGLKTTAHMMAERARFFKRDVEVPPMPPEERKIIHTFLARQKDIVTESQGEGPHRRVIIKYSEKPAEDTDSGFDIKI